MMVLWRFLKRTVFLGLFFPLPLFALQQGIAVSYGNDWMYRSNPQGIYGTNFAYTLQPETWHWKTLYLGFNASYGHWHTSSYPNNQNIDVFALAPVVRWYLPLSSVFYPFIQGSVGGAYLSDSYFGNRNLGSRLEFQDMGGLGLAFGHHQEFYLSVQSLHYSNANISSHNSGFSVPCLMTLGYQF